MTERPHIVQWEKDGPFVPISTEEIAPLVAQHSWHKGVAFFPDCPTCVAESGDR